MKILVLAQLNSPHTQRWCDWLMDHDVDAFPINTLDPNLIMRQIVLFKPDIIHAFFVPQWGYAAHVVNFHPYVITALGSDLLQPDRYDQHMIRKTLQNADAFFGFSQELVGLGIMAGAQEEKSHMITLGVDTSLFKPGYSPLYGKWHTTPDTKVILSCRHMSELYNHDSIIKALPKLHKKYGNINLVHVDPNGDPDYFNMIADLIDSVGMTEYVHSNAALPYYQMPHAYNACDVAIGIPTTDGMAISLLEASACKVPYIATNNSTNSYISPPEWLVDPRDPEQIAKALILAIDRRFPTNILERNRKTMEIHYEHDKMMEYALDIYRSLL